MKMRQLWHRYRRTYYRTLYRDCSDEKMKRKLLVKIHHHEQKLKTKG